MKRHRIVKTQYESGKIQYIIEVKWWFWWVEDERWDSLSYAQERLKEITQYKVVSEEIVG